MLSVEINTLHLPDYVANMSILSEYDVSYSFFNVIMFYHYKFNFTVFKTKQKPHKNVIQGADFGSETQLMVADYR